MYRWAPGNEARATTEPAPSDLLKATGMLRFTRRAEPATGLPKPSELTRQGVGCFFANLPTFIGLRAGWLNCACVLFANCSLFAHG